MEHTTTRLIIIPAILLIAGTAFSQKAKKLEITYETLKQKCDTLPIKVRPRVAVTRFNVTTTSSVPQLGENMATMLEAGLLETGCLNVLESLNNSSDMTQELDMSNSEYANKATVGKKGKMLGAQAIVTGEITEYNEENNGVNAAFVKTTSKKVHLGFILKVVDPETREIIWHKDVNVEGKSGGSFGFGVGLPLVGRLNLAGGAKDNPALANALNNGVLKACDMLADEMGTIPWPEAIDPNLKLTTITVPNTSFDEMMDIEEAMKGLTGVSKTEAEYKDGNTIVQAYHKGSSTDLAKAASAQLKTKFKVTGAKEGAITMVKK